jgi:tetratricopeptide (TPR) repeat protein
MHIISAGLAREGSRSGQALVCSTGIAQGRACSHAGPYGSRFPSIATPGMRQLIRAGCVLAFLAVAPASSIEARPQSSSPAQEHAERGRLAIARGEPKAAEAELRQAVQLAPQDAQYLALLGIALGMQQKLQESDVYLGKSLRLDPTDSATRRNLAWNQFQLGQLAPAKENLDGVLKQKPDDAAAKLVLGMVHEELRDYRAAVRLLESVPDQVRERPESLAALARAYDCTGRHEKARETLKELQQLRSAGPEGVFLGGQVAAELHDYEAAQSLFSSIWSTYPDTAKLGYNLALAQYRGGRFPQSQATLRRVISAGHDSSEIYNLLAWCFYKQDDFKGAATALDQAIALDPADESNYLDGGLMLIEHHLVEGALNAAEKALEVAPDSYRAHRLKALAEFKLGRVNDAEHLYARALELNPADAEALAGLATAQLDTGDAGRAAETLKKGIERLPRAAALYQAYGNLLLSGIGTGDASNDSLAIQLFEKAIALDNSLAEAHYGLGKLALREDRIRDALLELEAAVKLDPKSSKDHYGLAQVYRKLGRVSDAAREVDLFQTLKAKEDRAFSNVAAAAGPTLEPGAQPNGTQPK